MRRAIHDPALQKDVDQNDRREDEQAHTFNVILSPPATGLRQRARLWQPQLVHLLPEQIDVCAYTVKCLNCGRCGWFFFSISFTIFLISASDNTADASGS